MAPDEPSTTLKPVAKQVYFRGPMLVVVRGDTADDDCDIDRILIPNAARPLTGMVHPDGTPADVHFAGMIVADVEKGIIANVPLRGKRVLISDGSFVVCQGDNNNINTGVPLQDLTNSGENDKPLSLLPRAALTPDIVAADVTFSGGFLQYSEVLTRSTYSFPSTSADRITPSKQLPRVKNWIPRKRSLLSNDPVTITVTDVATGEAVVFYLNESEYALFFNWDVTPPTVEEFCDLSSETYTNGAAEDTDFKWVYQLMDPPGGWPAWLGDNKLPAPITGLTTSDLLSSPTTGVDCGDSFMRIPKAKTARQSIGDDGPTKP